MQGKNRLVWAIAIVAMFVAVLFYFYNEDNKHSWSESLAADGTEPYDLNIFFSLLEENTQNAAYTELTKNLNIEFADLDSAKTHNFYAIRRDFFPDTNEIIALEKFVRSGNNLIISANGISPLLPIAFAYGSDSILKLYDAITREGLNIDEPDSILEKYAEADSWSEKDSIHKDYQAALEDKVWTASFLDSANYAKSMRLKLLENGNSITLHRVYKTDTIERYWYGVQLPPEQSAKTLAVFGNDKAAFVKWKVGDGFVFIVSPPMLFSNYVLLEKENFLFCNTLLANVPPGDILVDNVTRFNRDMFTPRANLSQSPLSFILKQPALVWAWYTLLLAAIIFVVFRSKRKQRIIPIIKPNLNTTLAYAKMLGSLQLKEKNNNAKAAEIFQHFLQHLRSRNRWHSNEINDELKNILFELVPDLDREIQIVLHLGSKAQKQGELADQEVVKLFNYSKNIIDRV